jgi:hypothetical protein
VYEALAALNRDFEQVLVDLERLGAVGAFPDRWHRPFLEAWRLTLEETRAWVNFELVEILHEREERDWVHFSRLRQRAEQPSEAPGQTVPPAVRRARTSSQGGLPRDARTRKSPQDRRK